ncbi:hypothetical protein ABZ816_23525 [Actinosynnema sp. NPDC047251]|uniref:Uncharacterized protein n=1 Tax=Saccharothrix espanaensis (strain ATCC 51144 / DSM 44229 / JCM 9112 / NBRC 15066 / NRRL 15764) TaxID=1179773 RepID=K0JXF8_SACES|nr:hypothetical protein [Saccharothrix espanaensis]CCH32560.1 hypothetical protein BN6_52960 [Saccharothrix espanaensis DSM 44229]
MSWDLLAASASEASARPRRLDRRFTYLVEGGPVDLFAVWELPDGSRSRRQFVARCPEFSAVPPPASTGEGQLWAVPLPGARLRELHDPAFPGWAGALGPALDRALQAMSDRARPAHPPRHSEPLRPGALASGRSALCARRPLWLRAGGRFRVNGGDVVTAGRDAVLLAVGDWIRAEDDCVLNFRTTEDVLRAGGLTDVIGGHLTRLAGAAVDEAGADDERLLAALAERRRAHRSAIAATARRALGELGLGPRTGPVDQSGGEPRDVLRAVTGWRR